MSKDQSFLNRRPLKVREHKLSIKFSRYLAKKTITPNQISLLSIVFAMLSALTLATWSLVPSVYGRIAFLVFAMISIQGRLLCNLFDGMVAMEGGKKTPAGELFNDIPDRISDTLIFVALGVGLCVFPFSFSFSLGISAALFAALTAYIRTLGSSMGTPMFFNGPMAKQHRMALLMFGLIITIIELAYNIQGYALYCVLIIINIGSIWTCINRTRCIYKYMEHINVK